MERNNPLSNLEKTRDVAYVFAALSGAGIVFSIALGNLSDTILPYWAAIMISLSICVAVLYVIDYGMKKELPHFLDTIFGNLEWTWKKIAFCFLLFSILGLRVFTSASLTWNCRTDAAAAIIAKPVEKDALAASSSQSAAMAAAVSPIQSDIDMLNQKIISAEATAYQNFAQSSKDMIASGKDKWGYHAGLIEEAKKAASETDRTALAEKLKLKTETIQSFNGATGAILSSITTSNETNRTSYETKVSRNEAYYGYFGVGCLLFAILIEILLKLGEDEKPKPVSKKPRKKKKKRETSNVSEDSEAEQVSEPATETEWQTDETTGFNYIINNDVIMVQGFSGWRDAAACKKKVQQYLNKNQQGVGKVETNNRNIEKFNMCLELLGEKQLPNIFALKAAG